MSTIPMTLRAANWARFVKLEHTLFSLPMLFAGAWLAARGFPGFRALLLIILAGTGARIVALALNRIIDRAIDARNPRTAIRELPRGTMTLAEAMGVALAGLTLYVLAAWWIAPICALLSPIPLLVFVGYPYMKRFTPLAHLGVGLGLAVAPLGAWMAIRQSFAGCAPALWLGAFTLFWVAGFDVIYATQDEEFDRGAGLFSLPSRLGTDRALGVAAFFHLLAFAALATLFWTELRTWPAGLLLVVIGGLLALEHRRGQDVEMAFFTINAWLGFVVLAFVLAGLAFAVPRAIAATPPPAGAPATGAPATGALPDTAVWRSAGSYELSVTGGPGEGGHTFLSRDYRRLLVIPDRGTEAWLLDLKAQTLATVPVAVVEYSARGARVRATAPPRDRGRFIDKDGDILWKDGKVSYVIAPSPPLLGEYTLDDVLAHKKEYAIDARNYVPDAAAIRALAAVTTPTEIVVFFGTWCSSCRQWLPRFVKAIQAAANPKISVRFIAIDSGYAKPAELIQRYDVHMTPSLIVLRNARELGRIKGHPDVSIEADLVRIMGK